MDYVENLPEELLQRAMDISQIKTKSKIMTIPSHINFTLSPIIQQLLS